MHSFAIAILLAYTELTSSQFVGKWEGKFNDLPAIEITLVPDQDRISWYDQIRFSAAQSGWQLGGKGHPHHASSFAQGAMAILTFETHTTNRTAALNSARMYVFG